MAVTPFITDAEATQKIQQSYTQLEIQIEGIASGYRGTIAIADTPTEDGVYTPTEAGTYANAGGLAYDPEDTDNGKIVQFIKTGATWVKNVVPFDEEVLTASQYINATIGKNLFNIDEIIADKYMVSSGTHAITTQSGFGMSGMIPIVEGETYTLSGTRGRAGLAFFENDTDTIPIDGTWDVRAVLPIQVVAPSGANFVAFNLYSTASPTYSNIQFELGAAATSYEVYTLTKKIKPEFIDVPFDEEILEDGEKAVAGKTIYPIKNDLNNVLDRSPNLFDETKIEEGYIASSGTNPVVVTSDWGWSGYIPVTEGETYTLSGNRGRLGLAFFENLGDIEPIASSYNGGSDPLTVTAPVGANFVGFNVFSSSNPEFSNVQFELGSAPTFYRVYDDNKIKSTALPIAFDNYISLDSENPTNNFIQLLIGGKILRQNIIAYPSGTLPFDVTETYFDGDLIRETIDDTAPYRVDNATIGGNHDSGSYNSGISRKLYVDGKEVSEGVFEIKKEFKVVEKYTLSGINTAGNIAEISYSFVFDIYGNTVIYSDILGLQNSVPLKDIMFVMANEVNGDYSLLIPKSLPFSQDSVDYDFSSPFDMTGFAPLSGLDFTPARCEPTGILVDRVIAIKDEINFQIGYIPVLSAEISQRRINAARKALQIRYNTEKIYMSAIDSASITTLNQGDYFSVVCYKGYSVPKGNAISCYTIPTELGIYVYIDWDAFTGTDKIEMNPETIGKEYTVVEKSDSVSILTTQNSGTMVFDVDAKGYVILKFN